MAIRSIDGYSSTVEIHLTVDGEIIPVAQIGPSTLILREPRDIAPDTSAQLTITVDGRVERESIMLPCGSSRDTVLVKYF